MSSISEEKSEEGSEIEFQQDEISIENQSQQQIYEPFKKLDIQKNENDDGMASYVFYDEDHTLGNALRYILIKNPNTDICGYSIPHPSENKLVLRLQCIEGQKSNEILKQGLYNLQNLCIDLKEKVDLEIQNFQKEKKKKK